MKQAKAYKDMQTQLHNVQVNIKVYRDLETMRTLVKLSAFLDTTELWHAFAHLKQSKQELALRSFIFMCSQVTNWKVLDSCQSTNEVFVNSNLGRNDFPYSFVEKEHPSALQNTSVEAEFEEFMKFVNQGRGW